LSLIKTLATPLRASLKHQRGQRASPAHLGTCSMLAGARSGTTWPQHEGEMLRGLSPPGPQSSLPASDRLYHCDSLHASSSWWVLLMRFYKNKSYQQHSLPW